MTETRMLISGLQARGHTVAFASDGPLDGLECLYFPVKLPRTACSLEQMHAALASFKPDLVHVLFAFVGGVLFYSKVLRALPWVLTCHSVPPHEWSAGMFHRPDWLHYLVRAWRIRMPTLGGLLVYGRRIPPRIIVHSETIARHVQLRLFPRGRISIVPFGYQQAPPGQLWRDDFTVAPVPQLLTVAGITHTKGHHDVLAALPEVRRSHPSVKYTILGELRDPSYFAFLQKRIAELDLAGNVEFVIAASKEQMESAFKKTDLFVQPSHEEGFCLSYMEAASRVPRLVATKTGALAEMSEGDPGARVVPVGHPRALAKAMVKSLADALPIGHMRLRDERLARRFSWSSYLDLHESIYSEQIAKGAVAGGRGAARD